MLKKLILLWLNFLMVGAFTFGGGYAMIPLIIERVLVNNWATIDQIYEFIGIAEATPGSFAVNVSTFIGFNQAGPIGSFVATLSVVTPSFVILVLIAAFGDKFLKTKFFQNILYGIRPAVIGLIVSVAFGIVYKNLFGSTFSLDNLSFSSFDYKSFIILVVIATLSLLKFRKKDGKTFKINPIILIIISGLLGILLYL